MSKPIALTRNIYVKVRANQLDMTRCVIVLGSAAALILAGQPLPL